MNSQKQKIAEMLCKRRRYSHVQARTLWLGSTAKDDDCIDMELNCARHGSQSCKDANDVYRGIKRTTISGKTCQFWNKQVPHKHSYVNHYENTNYCRNPGGSKEAPWCYTMDPETEWEYCFPECKTYHSGNAIRRRRSMEHPVQAVPLKTLPTYLPTFETYQEEILNAKSLSEINSNYSHFEGDIVGITVDTIDEKVRLTNKADKFLHPLVAAKIDVAVAPGSRAAATTDPMKLWKEGVVPWEIYADYLTPAKALIASDVFNEAFRQIQELTCIQFVEVDHSIHQDYIYLAPNGTGCASYVGRRGGKQVVSLDATCLDLDTVLHELMHALGFVHEHSRPDRDEHIKIYWENVDKKEQDNFKKYNLNRISILGAPYDYNSVMHYGRKEFTFNGAYDTLRPKKCDREAVVLGPGNRGLSYYDAYKINKLYNCSMVQDDCINATGNCAKAGSVACRNSDLYKTIKRTTVTGRSCQPWDSQYPHKHQYSSYYGSTNYCRNPNGIKAAPWCLTMDPNTRWEYCFPQCDLSSAGDLLARLVVDAEERIDQAFGRLEVYHRGIWGTVAAEHNEQNRKLGAVVCRMLGLPSDNPIIYGSDKFGMGYGPIWLYNVSCDGTEHHIENCSNFQVQNWKIRHSKDIGLHCSCPNIVSVSGSVAAEIDFTTNEIIKTGNVTLRSTGNSIASGIDWGHGMKLEFYLQPTVPAKKRLVMLIEHAKNDNSSVVVRFNGQDNFEHRKSYDPILESAEDVYFVPGRFVKIGKCNEILIYNFNTLRKRYLIKKIKLVV